MPNSYIPPLRLHSLTPVYDAVVRWTSAENRFRSAVVSALAGHATQRILDIGCGTGSLAVMLKEAFPGAQVVGVDADEAALRIAAVKCAQHRADVTLHQSDARDLPFEANSFGAATASLFFHHLEDADKRKVLAQLHRSLEPGGSLVVADWHRADSALRRLAFNAVRLLDGFAVTRVHAHGRFAKFLGDGGFEVRSLVCVPAPLGTVGVWRCIRT